MGVISKKSVVFSFLSIFTASSVLAESNPATSSPNDPYTPYQSSLTASLTSAWEITTDASSVVIAVIDTGADLDHPDLGDNLWINSHEVPGNGIDDDDNGYVDDLNGYDFQDRDGDPTDLWGHGTLVAGIMGAVGDNNVGTAGVTWSTQLMILRVFGEQGTKGVIQDFTEAIDYAISNGARIINMSWTIEPSASGGKVPLLMEKIERAREAGIFVVAAAGNRASNLDETPVYPAAYAFDFDHVVSVAALEESEKELLDNSNYGRETVVLATSGDSLLAPYLNDGYATLTGTSAAAAMVSGVAALMMSERPDLEVAQIRDLLVESSHSAAFLDGIVKSGGSVDAVAALEAAAKATSGPTSLDSAGSEEEALSGSAWGIPGGCSLIR